MRGRRLSGTLSLLLLRSLRQRLIDVTLDSFCSNAVIVRFCFHKFLDSRIYKTKFPTHVSLFLVFRILFQVTI
jgi:hypothetical protein